MRDVIAVDQCHQPGEDEEGDDGLHDLAGRGPDLAHDLPGHGAAELAEIGGHDLIEKPAHEGERAADCGPLEVVAVEEEIERPHRAADGVDGSEATEARPVATEGERAESEQPRRLDVVLLNGGPCEYPRSGDSERDTVGEGNAEDESVPADAPADQPRDADEWRKNAAKDHQPQETRRNVKYGIDGFSAAEHSEEQGEQEEASGELSGGGIFPRPFAAAVERQKGHGRSFGEPDPWQFR